MSTLSVRLPDDLNQRLEDLAKKSRRSKSSFIKQMIEEKLEDYEEAYRAFERVSDKKAKYVTTEEVEQTIK